MDCLEEGEKIPNEDVREGNRSRRLTKKQLKLATMHKPAGGVATIRFDRQLKQHDTRANLLKELKLDVKLCSEHRYY